METKQRVGVVILAGGEGKRLQSETHKVLTPLHGKPLIRHLLERVEASEFVDRLVIVVGQKRELVMNELGDSFTYAIQEEQKGTGHAVMSAESALKGLVDHVLVLYGDMPYISPETIKSIVSEHMTNNNMLTMATITVPDFNEWRAGFFDFSRVIRDTNGTIVKTVEKKDATEEELGIQEVNPAYFCFNAKWLFENLKKLNKNNAQGEYYLTDLVKIACEEKAKLGSISIDPMEALGVNTRENLDLLHTLPLQ